MISKFTMLTIVMFSAIGISAEQPNPTTTTYGNVQVENVLRLDPAIQIHCNLKDMPPIIGQNIPVCIKGLKPSSNPQDNLELLMFLNELFLSKTEQPTPIVLKNIERGDHFCLVADILIDGQDLCKLLIEKNLVNKVIEVPSSNPSPPKENDTTPQTSSQTPSERPSQAEGNYIAAKSSKVYHRDSCYHVKRMDKSKTVTFKTPQEAEASGRRPCKVCKP